MLVEVVDLGVVAVYDESCNQQCIAGRREVERGGGGVITEVYKELVYE